LKLPFSVPFPNSILRPVAVLFLALLAAFQPARAQEDVDEEDTPRPIPSQKGQVFREIRSIPYPGGALYINRGLAGAFRGGKYQNFGDDQSLYQWQGEIGFFYTPWLSAGLAFKINAGEPSAQEQKVFNRYYLHARFHKPFSRFAIYAGPQIGVDNLNVLAGTDSLDVVSTNAGLGLEMGAGWKVSRWAGLTLGSLAEYSLVGDRNTIFGNDLNLRIMPGMTVDLLAFTDTLRELVPALYMSLEYQTGFLLFQRGTKNNDQAFMLGVGLAF
jgi:hypothetical protein